MITPVPVHVPPEGLNPVKVSATSLWQIEKPFPAFAICGAITFTLIVSLLIQPFKSVKV